MKIYTALVLFYSLHGFATPKSDCSSKNVSIKLPGFSGYGEELKKVKQIAQIITPTSDQPSTFEKSFEIGKYRFVRNDQTWDIYRKNENGEFEKKDIKGKFQVDADQKIWATVRSDGSINIHRNISGDEYQKEMNVFFTKKEVYILDADKNKIFSYENCRNVQAIPVKSTSNSNPNSINSVQGQK